MEKEADCWLGLGYAGGPELVFWRFVAFIVFLRRRWVFQDRVVVESVWIEQAEE
jgi:hypothetical protein